MSKKNTLCTFIHVPKTGGVTLHDVISRTYSAKQTLHIDNLKIPVRNEAELHAKQAIPFIIKGHIDVREVINIPNNYIFTFLRPPVARVISHYYFLKEQPGAKHHAFLNLPDTTIEKFYALKEKKDIDNCFVRYFSGRLDVECGMISKEHFDEALNNLKTKIHFFGMQEFYDESLIMLSNELQWPMPVYRKKNVTANKAVVTEQTMEFLRDANCWDVKLYEEAKNLFAPRLDQRTPKDKKRLSRLRMLNKVAALYPF